MKGTAACCVLAVVMALAMSQAGASSVNVEIVQQTAASTTFEIKVPTLESATVVVGADTFTRLSIPGCRVAMLDTGKPEVPRVTVMLAIPTGAEYEVTVDSVGVEKVQVGRVYPLQPTRSWEDTTTAFVCDSGFYACDTMYPADTCVVASSGEWRDLSVLVLHVFPVRVNPGAGGVELARYLRVTVSYSGGAYPATIADWMEQPYAQTIDNFGKLQLQPRDDADAVGVRLLVLRYDGYDASPALTNLLDWAVQRGYETRVIDDEWESISDTGRVFSEISQEYYSHNPPVLRWVMLVGEGYPTEITLGKRWGYDGDYPYGCVTSDQQDGRDAFPDIGVTRLSPRSVGSMDSVAAKILAYERTPTVSDSWLNRMTFVAHRESVPFSFPRLARDVAAMPYYRFWNPDRTVITGASGDNSDVRDALNQGTGILSYYGHGDSAHQSWPVWCGPSTGSWNADSVNALQNGEHPAIVIQTACHLGRQRNGPENLSETWLRRCPGGAVAAFGATTALYPQESTMCAAFVRAVCDTASVDTGNLHYGAPRADLGGMMMYSQAYFVKYELGRDDMGKACLVKGVMLGDPTMQIWQGRPEPAVVTGLPDSVDLVPTTLNLHVELADGGRDMSGAYACARGPGIYVTARSDDGQPQLAGGERPRGLHHNHGHRRSCSGHAAHADASIHRHDCGRYSGLD